MVKIYIGIHLNILLVDYFKVIRQKINDIIN